MSRCKPLSQALCFTYHLCMRNASEQTPLIFCFESRKNKTKQNKGGTFFFGALNTRINLHIKIHKRLVLTNHFQVETYILCSISRREVGVSGALVVGLQG